MMAQFQFCTEEINVVRVSCLLRDVKLVYKASQTADSNPFFEARIITLLFRRYRTAELGLAGTLVYMPEVTCLFLNQLFVRVTL